MFLLFLYIKEKELKMTKQEKKREYNRRYREKHPEITKKNNAYIKKRYFEDDKFREDMKQRQKKTYWKSLGYNYEVQILPITEFDTNADEVKLTRNGNSWIVEIKTRIKE